MCMYWYGWQDDVLEEVGEVALHMNASSGNRVEEE